MKKVKEQSTQVVSARIDRALVAQFDQAARAAGLDRNSLIERLIRAHLAIVAPAAPSARSRSVDPVLIALLDEVRKLFSDCDRRNSDLIVCRLPWSARARGDWPADAKHSATSTLARLNPPLITAGAGGRYRLNRRAWSEPAAINEIRRHWQYEQSPPGRTDQERAELTT